MTDENDDFEYAEFVDKPVDEYVLDEYVNPAQAALDEFLKAQESLAWYDPSLDPEMVALKAWTDSGLGGFDLSVLDCYG